MASSMSVFPLEKYQEGRQLGQGGFGTVYLYCLKPEEAARGSRDHTRLPVTVAVKRIVVTGNNASSGGQLYDSEYEVLSGLRHMNIVDLLGRMDSRIRRDIVEINLVMEACHGDLRSFMNARGSLAPMDASVLIRQALMGLKYLHSNNIVHKDLKPENILLLNTQGRGSTATDWSLVQITGIQAKITDFGLAKFYEQDQASFTMTVAGTPFYMCPRMWMALIEQQPFRGHWSVDQFSMGVIAYELMTGSRKQDKSGYSDAAQLRAKFTNADTDIVDFLIGMLREDPNQRQSAESLLNHPFINKGQEHLDRLRLSASPGVAAGAAGPRAASDPTVEALKRQVAQLEQYREQSDQTIAQLTWQLTQLQDNMQNKQASMERSLNDIAAKFSRLETNSESKVGQLESKLRDSESKVGQLESKLKLNEDSLDSLKKEVVTLKSKKKKRGAEGAQSSQSAPQPSPIPSPRPRRVLSQYEQKKVNNDLWQAVKIGSVDQIRSALDGGADIECKMGGLIDINGWLYENPTPLIIASGNGHLRAVECLLSHGCVVDSTDEFDRVTALHAASWGGHKEIVLLLLDKGASIDKVDKVKQTALYLASYKGRPECVRVLLERGADSSVIDNNWGKTAFQRAGSWNPRQKEAVLRVFREFGISQ